MARRVIAFLKAEVPVDGCLQFPQLEKIPDFCLRTWTFFLINLSGCTGNLGVEAGVRRPSTPLARSKPEE